MDDINTDAVNAEIDSLRIVETEAGMFFVRLDKADSDGVSIVTVLDKSLPDGEYPFGLIEDVNAPGNMCGHWHFKSIADNVNTYEGPDESFALEGVIMVTIMTLAEQHANGEHDHDDI